MEEENNGERCCRVDAATPVIAPLRGLFFPATPSSAHCSLLATFPSLSTSDASLVHDISNQNTTMTTPEGEVCQRETSTSVGCELPGLPLLRCAASRWIDGCAIIDVAQLLKSVRCTVQYVFSRRREQKGSMCAWNRSLLG